MQTRRIFIAVDISDEARNVVATYIDELRREFPKLHVGWERPEKLHLTLKFLGDVEDAQQEFVHAAMKAIAGNFYKFRLETSSTGVFPNLHKPSILWLGISGNVEMMVQIAEEVEREFETLGFTTERRAFKPHLTIGRLREPWLSNNLACRHLANKFEPVGFEVREIVIYESKLQPTGSFYLRLAAFPLREAALDAA